MEGWLYTLQSSQAKNDSQTEMTEHKVMLLQRMGGGVHTDPLKKPFI